MNCKDCIHYSLCNSVARIKLKLNVFGNLSLINNVDEVCCDFKSISHFLELPYQIGDTVFIVPKYTTRQLPYKCQITNLMISQNKKKVLTQKYRAMVLENGKTVNIPFDFSFSEIGVSVFNTESDALDAMGVENE